MPAIRVLCSEGQSLRTGSQIVSFPVLPDHEAAISPKGTALHPHDVEVADLSTSKSLNAIRISWFDLRAALLANESESLTYGLVYESPRRLNDCFRMCYRCPVGASLCLVSISVAFNREWLDAINSKVPQSTPGHNLDGATAFEALTTLAGIESNLTDQMAADGASASILYPEYLIASVLSDAIPRIGSYRSCNISGPIDEWPLLYYSASPYQNNIMAWSCALKPSDYDLDPHKYTKMQMQVTVTGYGYQSSTSSDYLSLVVLITHLLLALMHTMYIISTRRTSGCGDTFSELVALAQQSQPAGNKLRNICTGINRLERFKHKVRIKVSEKHAQHLELAFREADQYETRQYVALGEKYGG